MIKKIILVFVLIFAFCFTMQSKANAQDDIEKFQLVILGDSLASGYGVPPGEGYIDLLQHIFEKDGLDNVSIINASVAGNTTADALAMLDSVLQQHPHAAIIELGINDALNDVDPRQIQINLENIVNRFLNNNIPVMLIGVRPPLVSDIRDREVLTKIYKALAKKYKLTLYPHFLEGVLIERLGTYDFKYIQNDTLHPNADGVRIMVRKTYPVIKKFLTSL